MNTPKFIIGTGFYHKPGNLAAAQSFFETWLANTLDTTKSNPPETIFVLANGGCFPNTVTNLAVKEIMENRLQVVSVKANLGHIHQKIGKEFPAVSHHFCGWSASVLTLTMLAYFAKADLIFKEADCLAFGDWAGQLYRELETSGKSMLFGKSRSMPCAQSLFIIKHEFIPKFVSRYLLLGADGDNEALPESKFRKLESMFPEIGRFSFGTDRDRPIPYDDPAFYCQHLEPNELSELKRRGLI